MLKENLVISDFDFLKGRGQNSEVILVKPRETGGYQKVFSPSGFKSKVVFLFLNFY